MLYEDWKGIPDCFFSGKTVFFLKKFFPFYFEGKENKTFLFFILLFSYIYYCPPLKKKNKNEKTKLFSFFYLFHMPMGNTIVLFFLFHESDTMYALSYLDQVAIFLFKWEIWIESQIWRTGEKFLVHCDLRLCGPVFAWWKAKSQSYY